MNIIQNREYLETLFKKKNKHDTGLARDVLPFLTKRTGGIKNQFSNVVGEYVRNICNLKLEYSKHTEDTELNFVFKENMFSQNIAKYIEFESEDDRYDFIRFLDSYLFQGEKIKPIHPFLFNYLQISKKNLKNEFQKYGKFLYDVFAYQDQDIKSIFNNKLAEDILTELILNKLGGLLETKDTIGQEYEPLFPSLIKLYKEDLIYLSKNKDYFINSFPFLTHYYVFMYVCQAIRKFDQFTNANYDVIEPFYFALEWESISKRRKAAGFDGLKYLRERSKSLFPHIQTISQISHLIYDGNLFEVKLSIPFFTYEKALEIIQSKGTDFETSFLNEINKWTKFYSNFWASSRKLNNTSVSTSLDESFYNLYKKVEKGVNEEVAEKFGKNFDDLGYNQFIKSRGSLGQVLNIKYDFLILLTAVSVKNKRIPLNQLFNEFERRGISFDRYSKKEIINVLDKLNIIDKKSDSGDAQYVKPIL